MGCFELRMIFFRAHRKTGTVFECAIFVLENKNDI